MGGIVFSCCSGRPDEYSEVEKLLDSYSIILDDNKSTNQPRQHQTEVNKIKT